MDQPRLRREVGLKTVVSTGAGLALASISYVSLIEMSLFLNGNTGWIALGVAGIVCFLASRCFAELGGMYPSAAGIKLFIEKAFGEKAALILAGLYISTTLAIVGAETFILGNVIKYCMGELAQVFSIFVFLEKIPLLFWTLLSLLSVAWINVRGLKLSGRFQDWVSYFMFLSLIVISIWALTLGRSNATPSSVFAHTQSFFSFFEAVAVGIFLYLGFEWVTPLAEEVKEYKLIPQGMLGSILLLFITYSLLGSAMIETTGKEVLAQWITEGKPIPHVIFAKDLWGTMGLVFMLIMSGVASLTSFNAGLLTASRFLYALARDQAAPKSLSRLHPEKITPHIAIWTLFLVCLMLSVVVAFTQSIKPFIYLGAFASCLIYVTMALSLIRLRKLEPDRPRPYQVSSLIIPYSVVIFFSLLGVGLLLESAVARVTILIGFVLITFYVLKVVPKIRKQNELLLASKTKRRPRDLTQN